MLSVKGSLPGINAEEVERSHMEGKQGDVQSEDTQVVVDMYKCLELVMEILSFRTQHMEDQLKRFFIEGDDNGDGVLSFEEFDTLLKRIAPHFSERRILRMFREALMGGEEDGFAIEKSTFAQVCRNHGMVKLIDTEKIGADIDEAEKGEREERERKTQQAKDLASKMEMMKAERKEAMLRMEEESDEDESESDEDAVVGEEM